MLTLIRYLRASTIRAKWRKARKTKSSLSKREKMRRKPFSLRNRRSISLRRRYIALSYCQGSRRCGPGWNHWNEAEVQGQLQGFIVFVSAIHDPMQGRGQGADTTQQFAALDGVGAENGGAFVGDSAQHHPYHPGSEQGNAGRTSPASC